MLKSAVRGFKMLVRNPLRAGLLVGVLSVSIGLALIMITINGAFAQRLDEVRAQVGTEVTVRPAGTFGGGVFADRRGGNGPGNAQASAPDTNQTPDSSASRPSLTDNDLQKLTSIAHVSRLTTVITERYEGNNLKSAAIAGNGRQITTPDGRTFTPPVLVTGTDNPDTLASLAGGDTHITDGRTFTDSESAANLAVIGQGIATANNLSVGSTFTLNNTSTDGSPSTTSTTLTVIGIFTTGTAFGDNAVALPIGTARTIFGRSNQIDQAIVKVDSVDNIDAVANDIKNILGTDKADVTTAQALFSNISSPLSDAENSSRIGMIVALVASAAIILFSIGLVARQRIKEIGIFKAVGASGWNVVSQFAAETGLISVTAGLIGALATFPLAQTVANGLVSSPTTAGAVGRAAGGGRFALAGPGPAAAATNLLGSVNVAVSPEIFLYALGIAIGLALLASVVPAWYVDRVRPAEVLRHE